MESLITDIFFAQCQPQEGGKGGGMSQFLCMMLPMIGIFYALLIRPQRQQQKQHAKMMEEIKSGDRVIAAGMVGTITNVKKDTIILKSADSKVELARSAVERVITGDDVSSDKK